MISVQHLFRHVRHQHTAGRNHTVSNSFFFFFVSTKGTDWSFVYSLSCLYDESRSDIPNLISILGTSECCSHYLNWTKQSNDDDLLPPLMSDLLPPFVVSEPGVKSSTLNTSLEADVLKLCGFFFTSHKHLLVAGVQLPTSD